MLNLIICGAPGSGKGTQSDLLVEKYNLKHLSTGDLLRHEITSNTPAGILANSYISQGQLVPDEMIVAMLDAEMDKISGNYNGLILDGFPRTVAQAESLEMLLEKRNKSIDLLIDIDVEESELIERLLKRGETSGRNDDNIETIKKRLDVYHIKTKPVSDFFKNKNQYALIDGMGGIHEIHSRITHLIEKRPKK